MQAESTLEVSWDGEVIPDVVRVADSTEYRNAVVIERSLTEDSSLKAWMDFVIILSMRQELHDASQVSKDISIQERGESSEVTHRVCGAVSRWNTAGTRHGVIRPRLLHPIRWSAWSSSMTAWKWSSLSEASLPYRPC